MSERFAAIALAVSFIGSSLDAWRLHLAALSLTLQKTHATWTTDPYCVLVRLLMCTSICLMYFKYVLYAVQYLPHLDAFDKHRWAVAIYNQSSQPIFPV